MARALRPDWIQCFHISNIRPLVQRSSTTKLYQNTFADLNVATQDLDTINIVTSTPHLDYSYDQQVQVRPLSHENESCNLSLPRSPISVMFAVWYRQLVPNGFECWCAPFLVVSLLLRTFNSIFIVWLLGLVMVSQCHAAIPCLLQTQCMNDCTQG